MLLPAATVDFVVWIAGLLTGRADEMVKETGIRGSQPKMERYLK